MIQHREAHGRFHPAFMMQLSLFMNQYPSDILDYASTPALIDLLLRSVNEQSRSKLVDMIMLATLASPKYDLFLSHALNHPNLIDLTGLSEKSILRNSDFCILLRPLTRYGKESSQRIFASFFLINANTMLKTMSHPLTNEPLRRMVCMSFIKLYQMITLMADKSFLQQALDIPNVHNFIAISPFRSLSSLGSTESDPDAIRIYLSKFRYSPNELIASGFEFLREDSVETMRLILTTLLSRTDSLVETFVLLDTIIRSRYQSRSVLFQEPLLSLIMSHFGYRFFIDILNHSAIEVEDEELVRLILSSDLLLRTFWRQKTLSRSFISSLRHPGIMNQFLNPRILEKVDLSFLEFALDDLIANNHVNALQRLLLGSNAFTMDMLLNALGKARLEEKTQIASIIEQKLSQS